MNIRRVALLLIPVIALGIAARVVRMRSPSIWPLPAGTNVYLAPNGSRLVCDPHGVNSVSIWDVAARREVARLPWRRGYTDNLAIKAISPDGRHLALWRVAGGARSDFAQAMEVWDIANASPRLLWRRAQSAPLYQFVFVDEGLRVLQNSVIKTYDANGKLVSSTKLVGLKPNEILLPGTFSPDGSLLIDGTNLRIFDARNGKLARRLESSRANRFFNEFSFAPDNRFLIARSNSLSTTHAVWNVSNGRMREYTNQISEFWLAQGHSRVRFDGRVKNVATRQKMPTIRLPDFDEPLSNIQVSRDQKVVAVQTSDGRVWIQTDRWF